CALGMAPEASISGRYVSSMSKTTRAVRRGSSSFGTGLFHMVRSVPSSDSGDAGLLVTLVLAEVVIGGDRGPELPGDLAWPGGRWRRRRRVDFVEEGKQLGPSGLRDVLVVAAGHGLVEPAVWHVLHDRHAVGAPRVLEEAAYAGDVGDRHRVVALAVDREDRRCGGLDDVGIRSVAVLVDLELAWLSAAVQHDHADDLGVRGRGEQTPGAASADAEDDNARAVAARVVS